MSHSLIQTRLEAPEKRITWLGIKRQIGALRMQQKLERMTSLQLRAAIAELRPPEVHDLVERDHEVLAARQARDSLSAQLCHASMEVERADRQIVGWRAAHLFQARLHDLGLMPSRFVGEREAIKAAAEARRLVLAAHLHRAEEIVRNIESEVEARIRQEQAPVREYMAELEYLERKRSVHERELSGQWREQDPDNVLPATDTPSFRRSGAG